LVLIILIFFYRIDPRVILGNAAWIWTHENLDAFELFIILEQIFRHIRCRLFMKIPFDLAAAAGINLSRGLFDPILIDVIADKIFLSYILIMSLGFDRRAIGLAAVVKTLWFSRRWISKAKSEPRGQRRLPLRIDDAVDLLLVLNIEKLTPFYVFRAWIGTKFRLLAFGLRLRVGADPCASIVLLLFLRRRRRAHGVGIDDDAAPACAGDRRTSLVAKDAILSEMGGSDGLIARRTTPRDDKRAFIMVEAVVEAGLTRHGADRKAASAINWQFPSHLIG